MDKDKLLERINLLVHINKYKPLDKQTSERYRKLYQDNIPCFLRENTNGSQMTLLTANGTVLSRGFERIVIGDYGAYIEISEAQINKELIMCPPEQKYRYEQRYKFCKYYWLSIGDGSNIKIYFQRYTVKYADYKPGFYYVSVYEVQEARKIVIAFDNQGEETTNE